MLFYTVSGLEVVLIRCMHQSVKSSDLDIVREIINSSLSLFWRKQIDAMCATLYIILYLHWNVKQKIIGGSTYLFYNLLLIVISDIYTFLFI